MILFAPLRKPKKKKTTNKSKKSFPINVEGVSLSVGTMSSGNSDDLKN